MECNLSNPLIKGSRFNNADFSECKLVGLNFYNCEQLRFDLAFSKCRLRACNFSGLKMKGSSFLGCAFDDCYFENTYLVDSKFDDSAFRGTLFHACDLGRASFLEAEGYAIDPRNNNVKKAVFSVPEVLSLIESFGVVIKNRS